MLKQDVFTFDVSGLKERYAIEDVRAFIDNQTCRRGKVFLLNGIRRTGKTVLMEQVLSAYRDKVKCAYYEANKRDDMQDVETMLLKERDSGTKIVCIDEITRIRDFITDSSSLPDIFAKAGMSVIITGTDSLSLSLAEDDAMFDRTKKSRTFTHIPFAEHAAVLGTKNIDDYIQYGGLMSPGKSEEGVYDIITAKRYLDSAVTENIMHSLANNYRDSALEALTFKELCQVTNRLVEKYSGHFSTRDFTRELKGAIVMSPLSPLPKEEEVPLEKALKIVGQKKEIAKDFAIIVQAEGSVKKTVTSDMVKEYTNYLRKMGVVSLTEQCKFNFIDKKWEREPNEELYHIVQPAIRYYHLLKGQEFITKDKKFSHLDPDERKFLRDRLDNMIKGEMSEQIVLFDTSSYLPTDRYSVMKATFTVTEGKDTKDVGEYDMLIYDKEQNMYWIYEIKHSQKTDENQLKNLLNEDFRKVADTEFGKCQGVIVLYNGEPRNDDSGVVYLNMADFLVSLDKTRSPEATYELLSKRLVCDRSFGKEISVIKKTINNPIEYTGTPVSVNKVVQGIRSKKEPQNKRMVPFRMARPKRTVLRNIFQKGKEKSKNYSIGDE